MNPRELHLLERKGKRLVLFPLPLQGHINPMLQLANILYSKGFSISIILTEFNSPNPSNYPQFSFHSISNVLTESQASPADPIALHTQLNDAMWHFSQAVADSLRIPRLVLRTTSACSFLAWDAFPLLREKGYLPQQESQLEESVAELPTLKVKDLSTINTQNSDNFYDLLLNMFKETKSSSGLILNTFQDLEQSALLILNSLRNRPISQILPCMQRPPLQVAY